jgi:hypothetical protein
MHPASWANVNAAADMARRGPRNLATAGWSRSPVSMLTVMRRSLLRCPTAAAADVTAQRTAHGIEHRSPDSSDQRVVHASRSGDTEDTEEKEATWQ